MIWYQCFLLWFAFLVVGCSAPKKEISSEPESNKQDSEGFKTLTGKSLPKKQLSEAAKSIFEQNLQEAKANLDQYPDSLDLMIWYGRRLAYLGQHKEAIQAFSDGLKQYPESHRLKRHRGHRYITTRQLELAIKDFGDAVAYSSDRPNAIEPDGLPNVLGIPLGNDMFNIWYHFGLAHYLNGNYNRALEAYRQCMTYSDNDDLKAATSYWLYMAAVKSGSNTIAERTLQSISTSWEMVENEAYMDLLLLFKGINSADQLLQKITNDQGIIDPTYGYGIGFYYEKIGKPDKAAEVFEQVLKGPGWESFGYIACEAAVAR